MSEAKYTRKRKSIKNIAENKTESFESINEAKRESRKLQMSEDGALGRGSLIVK